MTGTRIVLDGLWRCLCPSVDTPALLRAVDAGRVGTGGAARLPGGGARPWTPHGAAARPRRIVATAPAAAAAAGDARCVHSGATARVGRVGLLQQSSSAAAGNGAAGAAEEDPRRRSPLDEHQMQLAVHALLMARPPYRRELVAAPTAAIYAALRHLQDQPRAFDRIHAYARFLLDERHEAPSAALYEALVRANCHTSGSADAVRDVLRALKEAQIEATPSLYHGALSVLAVHPDYLLRNTVLQEMKARWMDLTPDGMQSVALGLLRDGQYERALDQLEAMTEAAATAGAAPVPAWLLDIFVFVLGQEGFLDDALTLVNHRLLRDDDAVSLPVWSFLLDACCRGGHYEGVVYVWNRVVAPGGLSSGGAGTDSGLQRSRVISSRRGGRLTPSDAVALDVLNLAARHGDANLAAAVMQMLAARGTKLGMPHFEAMLDCYAHAGAVDRALQALCIMHNAGIVPDQGSTRSIFLSLTRKGAGAGAGGGAGSGAGSKDRTARLDAAVAALFDLKKQYGSVPVAAFNVVLEALLAGGGAPPKGPGREEAQAAQTAVSVEPALDLYRHVRQLCPAGPSRATFRLLFRACADPQHLDFLLCEMRAFALRPDLDMIDRTVHANARYGSLDVALRHVFDLMGGADGNGSGSGSGDVLASPSSHPDETTPTEGIPTPTESSLRRRWISRWTAVALARRCIDEQDERIWAVADASRKRGRPMDAILQEAAGGAARPGAAAPSAYGVPHAIALGEEGGEEGDDAPSPSEATFSG